MKKKISLFLCMLVLALCVTGCSSKDSGIEYDAAILEQQTETIINGFSQMEAADFAEMKEASELKMNLMLMNIGLPMERDDFVSMMDAWQAGEDECGDYIGHGDYEITVSANEVKVKTEAEFAERTATLTFTYDEKLNMESMTINAEYSTGEILKKAGLNTLLGMGTVFCVLVFLSFLISLFKYIPSGEKKAKKTAPVAAPAAEVVPAAEAAVDETDDLELVAVITAAIAASEGASSDGFIVRSIKRRKTNKWN